MEMIKREVEGFPIKQFHHILDIEMLGLQTKLDAQRFK